MTTEEKLNSLVDAVGSLKDSMGSLKDVVSAFAPSVIHRDNQIEAHDRQIDGLIQVAEKQAAQITALSREWQAYLKTIRPQ